MIQSKLIIVLLVTTTLLLSITYTNAIRFHVTNNCPYTVWAASFPFGGGRRLDSRQTWSIKGVPAGTKGGHIWARTGCTFDRSGQGYCLTGDCDGQLKCKTYGKPPNTVARYSLNAFQNLDFFDVSVVEGFNVPMEFSPDSGNCTQGPRCTADLIGQCPNELRTQGGCNDPCTVFKTSEYCCTGGSCGPTDYSRFFKSKCPDAYSYPTDNLITTIFSCPSGRTNYRVVFCP